MDDDLGPWERATGERATRVRSSAALRAFVHPLRMRLLDLLRQRGPATASGLGRVVGESSGVTSYHLRQLERYGFVEPAPDQPNRRDKVWRAVHDAVDVDLELLGDPESVPDVLRLVDLQVDRFRRGVASALVAGTAPGRRWDGWRESMTSSDATLRLDAALAQQLRDEIAQLVARWSARSLPAGSPGAERVLVLTGLVPVEDDA